VTPSILKYGSDDSILTRQIDHPDILYHGLLFILYQSDACRQFWARNARRLATSTPTQFNTPYLASSSTTCCYALKSLWERPSYSKDAYSPEYTGILEHPRQFSPYGFTTVKIPDAHQLPPTAPGLSYIINDSAIIDCHVTIPGYCPSSSWREDATALETHASKRYATHAAFFISIWSKHDVSTTNDVGRTTDTRCWIPRPKRHIAQRPRAACSRCDWYRFC
jgi:hypothetical protein